MNGYAKTAIIIIIAAVIVILLALLWPRPCTPDVECTDYETFLQEINQRQAQ